ncbi:hypothetical protein J3U50_06620 [Lactobacillus sp. B3795]|uniref:DUF5776 domain-containing protein n=1 Tax=Lactobacillus sp. B3795 TaxID=2818036 RepID=UPI00265CFFDF|nr:DUF5776 domain-containing protein [Lactobacillus sp. B3795]MCX8743662.1 hypothetical protein [Lactobacillus sp. B3795]
MQYNKNKFNKVNDKKVMKKVKKQWVVVSVATLALFGASAYGMTSTSSVVAHADGTTTGSSETTTQQGGSNGTATTNSGNSGESQSQQGSSQNSGASVDTAALKSAAASQGSSDGTAGVTQSALSSYQDDYNAAYSAASTAASTAASSAGSSDFAAKKSKASYPDHQDAYNTGYDAASSTAQSQQAAAIQRGHDDFAAGNSQATLSSNNDLYSSAYTAASSASAKGHNDFAAGSSHATSLGSDQDVYDTAFNAASNAAFQGLNDFVTGNSKASNYGTDQDVYDTAFETASSAASQGAHDFNTTGSQASNVADQSLYNSAFSSARQTSINNSVAASANATSAGIDDYVEGHTVNSNVGSVNQSTYNTAYSMASSGFNDTLNGNSAAESNASDSNYQKGVGYASGSYAAAMSAAISDAVYGTNNQQSYATDAVQSAFYSAAYAGAEAALAQYNNKVGTQGTGSQAYVYYKNTANSVYSTSYAPGSASGANVTNGYVNASNVSYNASYAATYTGQYSDAPQGTVGGADDPKTAHDTAISYENDISNLYDNANNAGINASTTGVTVASQHDVQDNSSLLGALSVVYRYGINNALIQQGIKDAETGKWQGITGANGKTGSIYTPNSNSDNLYDQAYLGAQAAINTQFKGDNYTGVAQLSNPSNFTSAYKVGYNDVYSKDQQGVYYVSTGTQMNKLLTGGSTSVGGTVNSRIDTNHKNIINIINDISLVGNSASNGSNPSLSNSFENLTIDGNNHIADWYNQNYTFSTVGDGNQSVHLQNFKTIYGANYFGPVGFSGSGNVYFKNFNYIGAQLLSAINNQVFMDGNVNVSQRDDFYTSPWESNVVEAGPGNQLNLYIKNLVLNKGAHYFGTAGAHSGTSVVYVSGGNVTLSENSSMTVINRGTGADGANGYGVQIAGGSLNVNKNANLNIMQDNTTAGSSDGGIYVNGNSSNSNAVTVDGGRINIETANFSNIGSNQLVYVQQGKVLVTNGGVLQAKATNIGNNVQPNGLIYIGSAGQINVANRGNLIVSTPDGSGNSAFPLISGTLTVNDSGDSHVILDKGSTSSKAVFVNSSGSINSYTGKVNGTIYYNYSMTSNGSSGSETVNALNKDMQSISNKKYSTLTSTPQVLEIQSIPSVYFSSPLTTSVGYDNPNDSQQQTVTVTGYAKVSGYQSAINSGGTDAAYAKNKVYIQYATGNTTGTIYDSLGNASTGPGDYHNLTPISTSVSSANKNDSSIPTTGTISNLDKADTNAYNDDADPSSSIIPIKFTVPLSNAKTVGVYLRYGVNGVYMTALSGNNQSGGSTYASNIEGYQLSNGKLVTAPSANVSIASGNGQDTENGYQQAISDFGNGQYNPDLTKYGRNADYTNAYDSVMAGAGALTPDFLRQLGVTDPTVAPSFDSIKNNPELLSKIQALPSYQSAKNPTAYLQAMGQAYQDYLANKDAVSDINTPNNVNTPAQVNSSSNDALYKSNFNNAYQNAQNAINDAVAGNTSNRPKGTDPIGQQVYDKVKQQYNSGITAMDAVAKGVPSAPDNTDPTAFSAAQKAYGQIVKDIRSGKTAPATDFSQAPYNSMTPLQQALYKQGFANAYAKYQTGQQAALNGKGAPSDPQQLAGYNDTKDGFNENPTSSDPTTEQNSPAYQAGKAAKTDETTGANSAKTGQSLPASPSQAEIDGYNGTKDAYAVATGKKQLSTDQLKQQSLAYQAAYNDAIGNANQVVSNALSDYKNGNKNAPQGTGVDNQAYTQVQNAAAAGASDANQPNSPAAPDSSQSDAYKEGYDIAKGSADALSGAQKNSNNNDDAYKDAFDNATDGFNGDNNNAPENQTTAYQAGQKAKNDSKIGADLATAGQSLPATPSQAETDGFNATKDALDAATGKQTKLTADQLKQKSLAYQDAYNKALALAGQPATNALADYKSGSQANRPQGNGLDRQAYDNVQNDAAAGASDANNANSADTPASDKTPAYKTGYDIAKGVSDAENGKSKDNSANKDQEYTNAYSNFNDGKAQGESAKLTDSAPANADPATKAGFEYGQGIAALKNAQNPATANDPQGLTAKQQEGYDQAKSGYDLALSGQQAPTSPAAAVEGYNYAKALTDGASASTRPTQATGKDDLATEQKAYDDVQAAVAQAKSDARTSNPTPNDGNAHNKDVYDKAYAAALKAYQNSDPSATASSKGINNDVIGAAAFNAAKADGLKLQGANLFTNGSANNQSDPTITDGYKEAKQGYADALHGKDSQPNASDAYALGYNAASNDKSGFQNAENGISDNSEAAQGAADAIAKVKNAKGNVDSLSEINDSSKPAAYNNAYNAALEDAKQAARQGIASQLDPNSSDGQAAAPTSAALAEVYNDAASDAQKGYAEGLTGKSVSNGNNTSESKGFQKGSGDAAAYEAAVQDYANANGDVNAAKAAHPEKENDSVYQQTLKALDEGAKGITDSNDKSPVYAVANSQALAKKAAMDAIKAANTSANGTEPSRINSINDVPAGVSDKQSYMNAYNDAIKGYNAGKANDSSVTADNSDPADQQAFNDAKAAGEAARGADALLDGSTTAKDVDGTNANPSYIAGVDEASSGYADGLNGTKTAPEDVQATPAYQKAYAQGQADQAGVSAAKETQNPDTNTAPDTLPSNAAKDAYLGYANAIAAVKNAHGNPSAIQTPANYSQQSSDYKAAYQKALQDAVDANKDGQDSVANPSSAAARPSDTAQAAVYDAARADASKGYAEGLTGKSVSDPNNGNEQAGLQAGANDKAKYEAAVNDYATANGNVDAAKAADPANASDPVYQQTLKALDDASKGRTDVNDKSPVYAVANSQALAKKAAMDAINDANKAANGTDPQQITDANNVPADVPDKQSYMNAFNDAIKGYNAGKADDSSVTPTNSDPADQQAFKDAKAAGEAARGADALLDGSTTAKDVDGTNADPSYIAGVDEASSGYSDGLNGTKTAPEDVQATPAYQKAYAQGQADQKGVNEAKAQGTPDSNNVPSDLQGNKPATDAFKGYADAIAAVKAKNGNAAQTDRPTDFNSQSSDYKAAYQKALEDAIAANKAGQNAVATPGQNDTKPTDPALAAVYDAAKHDTNKGMAEVLSGKQGSSNLNNANEQAGIQAGTPLQAAYQAAARDFAAGNTDPTHIDQIAQTFGDTAQAYKDALAGMMDGSQTPASDHNDPKSSSPIYALAKQQAQNVQNAVAAVQGSQHVASGQSDKDADLANANGYNNPDNKSDMDDAYIAAANAYSDAINHTNGDEPTDQSGFSPADQVAYAQAYKAAKDDAAKGLTDFGNGNKAQQPANPADKAAYDKAQIDALAGLNAGLANKADATKQANNPAYKQGIDDAAAIQKAAQDAVNGTPDAGKASLTSDAQKAAYDAIKPAAEAGQAEYSANPDKYAGKTGDDLKNAANQAAQAKYPNDSLKQAAFAQAIEAAGDAFGKGAGAFGNNEQQPAGIAAAGYQAAQQAYDKATNGEPKPDKVNGHYPTPEGVTPSDQYDNTFDAAYNKYKTAADKAAQDTAANGGTAATAANSNDYNAATPKEKAAYDDAATKAAQGIADAKLNDPTKDAQYGTTKDGKFVPKDDTAAQAYAGAKAGYADGKTGSTNEPTNVSPAFKAAYDKANADAKAAAQAGVEDFAKGLSASQPTEDAQAAIDAHDNGYSKAASGYDDAMSNPSGDFSSDSDASYQKGVEMAKVAVAARDNILNNGNDAQPTPGESSTDADVSGAAQAAAAAAKAALADGKNGLDKVTNAGQVPDAFKPYAQIYADAYATVENAAAKAAQDGAKAFVSDGKEGNHVTDPNNKSVDAVANQEGYIDARLGYQDAQENPDAVGQNPNTGSVNGDEAAKGAAAAFNDVAGKDNAKPGDHATSDNNPVYEAAYQKALAEGKNNASDGAEALFGDDNPTNSTASASTLAKPNATTASDKAFNKGLENAKDALSDAQADNPSKDAQYSGDNADTDAGNVYHATQDAYNAVLNGQQPLTASELAAKDPVYAAAYKNALSRAQTASTNGATDTNDNGSSYAPNSLAQAVYEKARNGANNAYKDALQNKDPELKDHNGIDKSSVAYQATQNAINDYLKNNGNAKEDPTAAGMDPANAQAYKAYYEKAKAAVSQAAIDGVNAYLGGKAVNDVPSVEGDNAGLGEVAKEAAQRAEKGHEDAVNNGGRVSDDNQSIAKDPSYLTGLKGAQDAAKGVEEAKADATNQPSAAAPQAEKDGFNGTVDGYNKAATDGSIKPEDIDAYIANNLGNKSIAYRDAFKKAYLDGLKVAKTGADAANANEPDATKGQNGAAQKAQSQAYNDATNAFLDKLHGVDDKDATSNTPAAVAGRQRASQYVLALQDIADGHPNTGSTDPDYQKGLATAEAAVAQAVADAKANKQLPADLSQIPVPNGVDPVAYRDAYAGILSGFYNGYNSKSTQAGINDAYYNIAFGIGFAKGKASIPTDTSAPLDFWKNDKAPKITDPAVAKAYKEQYAQAKAGFYDALKKRGSKSNNEYYKESYKTAMDGLAGMRLAAKGDTKANRDILKTKDAAFISGYNGYLKGIEAAKRTLKKNKKLSAKDLLNKDKLYSYTFKEGLKHEIKIQRSHGKKAGINKALERHAIPKDIYTHHSATYARTFVATYKKEMKRHMPRYIYNVGTIFTHNRVKFTNHTRIREYAYSARYNSTVFRVVGVKYYKNRIPRYRLSNGDVVTASQQVQSAYYKKQYKEYRVIKPTGTLIHTGKTFSERNSVRRLYRGEVFHVRKVVKFHGITRLYVGKNEYITSNKTYVKAVIK